MFSDAPTVVDGESSSGCLSLRESVSQGKVMISQGRIEDFTFGHQDQADDVDWIVDKLVTIINAANLMDSSDDEADACRTARA